MLNAPKLETSVSAFQGVTLRAFTVMYLILFGKSIINPVCGYFDYFLALFDILTTGYVHSDLRFEFSDFQGVTLGAFTVMYLILVIFVTRCFLNEVYLIIFSYGKYILLGTKIHTKGHFFLINYFIDVIIMIIIVK